MKYAWKDSKNNINFIEVLSGTPDTFLPEGSVLGEIPSEIPPEDYKFLKTDFIPEVIGIPEYWSKDGEDNSFVQPMTADDSWIYHEAVTVPDTIPEYWSKDGEEEVLEQPMIADDSWTYNISVESIKAHHKISVDQSGKELGHKKEQVTLAYKDMNNDVYAQMEIVFGTTNPESASAYERTWQMMKENSEAFANVGIKNDLGFDLLTGLDVLNFATEKLDAVLAYGVWRLKRIEDFRALRSSLLS
jgi:hypothetical protein